MTVELGKRFTRTNVPGPNISDVAFNFFCGQTMEIRQVTPGICTVAFAVSMGHYKIGQEISIPLRYFTPEYFTEVA